MCLSVVGNLGFGDLLFVFDLNSLSATFNLLMKEVCQVCEQRQEPWERALLESRVWPVFWTSQRIVNLTARVHAKCCLLTEYTFGFPFRFNSPFYF